LLSTDYASTTSTTTAGSDKLAVRKNKPLVAQITPFTTNHDGWWLVFGGSGFSTANTTSLVSHRYKELLARFWMHQCHQL